MALKDEYSSVNVGGTLSLHSAHVGGMVYCIPHV